MAVMSLPKLRLGLAVALFAAWMSWLIYLALADRGRHARAGGEPGFDRLILSRPQFLVSNLDVVAQIETPDSATPQVRIAEVLWPKGEEKWIGKTILISNLAESKDSWIGKESYILPLMTDWKNDFRIAPIPRSPGSPDPATREGRPRIYADSPETRQQHEQIRNLASR
jgi:hypothetical protein